MEKGCEGMKIEPMIRELVEVNGLNWSMPKSDLAKEELLKTLMTISAPVKLSDEYYEAEKQYLNEKLKEKDLVYTDEIEEQLMDSIYIFKGDITTIEADAIVNAANEKLLGCFIPGHNCIDNAIHMAAGLGLRHECHVQMERQGHDEEVGKAKITKGYSLPSKYVVHTVGPNINGLISVDMDEVEEKLKECYLSVLREINQYYDIRNVVFCSISTGVYGVPIGVASKVALETIKSYLQEEKHNIDKVIIDVFSGEDYYEYKKAAKEINERM